MKPKFILDISDDYQNVSMHVSDFKNLEPDHIYRALENESIVFGIKNDVISKIFDTKSKGKLVIASWKPMIESKDDDLKIFINIDNRPVEEKGKINYRNRNFLKSIRRGERILTFKNGFDGEEGILVNGTIVKPKPRHVIKLSEIIENKNIIISKDGNGAFTFLSSIDGSYYLSKGKILITDNFVLEGDLDFNTGNLYCIFTDIYIKGNIHSGFSVKSDKDLKIDGNLENAIIKTKNLVVKGTISAGESDVDIEEKIECEMVSGRKNIVCKDMKASTILGSRIGSINFTAEKLSGGKTFIHNTGKIDFLGAAGIVTIVVLGLNQRYFDEAAQMRHELAEQRKKLRFYRQEKVKVSNDLVLLKNRYRKKEINDDYYYGQLVHLEGEEKFLVEDIFKVSEKESFFRNELKRIEPLLKVNFNSILYSRKITPGTSIRFGYDKPFWCYREYNNVKISYKNGISLEENVTF
ncbi:MAG: DUF342 domain-containing protein [Candidatus Delongbacteria bacterium]|nr:DUF342 domain-containing protein [Candidatus Delongbacteria bacterium]MBN2836821.1 DUF342 domain-containing protein [Candidatus Delongbacteria bacterium]